jgi:adenylate cyclase
MTRAEKWQTVMRVVAITAPLGAVVGLAPNVLGNDGVRSIVAGGLIGLLITIGMVSFEVCWAVELISRRWREAPFLVVLTTRSLVWLVIIVVGISVPLVTVNQTPLDELTTTTIALSVGVSFAAALVINFIGQINRLLGRGVMVRLILGRYHRPREEVRIFLLIDLRGSTQIAERLGNLRYHGFLKRFIGDVTTNAMRHGGELHRYVGDEVIVTWTERRGVDDAACVRCVFAIADALELTSAEYAADFGVAPRFWAGLHLGPVVTGEVGTVKHEIVYLGDTLNTSARIEQACRTYGRPFLASADVIEALELPSNVATESLGPIELRGVRSSVELLAISRTEV